MTVTPLNRRELGNACFVSFFLAVFLAAGFLPTAEQVFRSVVPSLGGWSPWWQRVAEMAAFPLLAALFHFSLPRRRPIPPTRRAGLGELVETFWVPVIISLAYGYFRHGPSLVLAWKTEQGRLGLFWYLACVTVGEELLFRGWFYNVIDRVWPNRMTTATNPLPVPVWMTAIGFSLWHWQNITRDPLGAVAFQSMYTLFTGLWLGYLRWKSGRLGWSIAGHMAINAACGLF